MPELTKKSLIAGLAIIFAAGILIGRAMPIQVIEPLMPAKTFDTKTLQEQRAQILSEIDIAIQKAKTDGIYNCCISPPCRECFVREGKCDCRERLLKGGDVCDECKKGLGEGRVATT